jgi:hypothetical protein
MGKHRAIAHLDHLLSLWPKMYAGQNCVPVGALKALMDVLGRDEMTDWEIRYFAPTGQANEIIVYGNSGEEVAEDIREGKLAQLRYYAKLSSHDSIVVVAGMYSEEKEYEYGDKTVDIRCCRTPTTECWQNTHFDPSRYKISKREHFVKKFPGKSSLSLSPLQLLTRNAEPMPVEYFDDEVLAATQANHEDRNSGWTVWRDGVSGGERGHMRKSSGEPLERRCVTAWLARIARRRRIRIRTGNLSLILLRTYTEL